MDRHAGRPTEQQTGIKQYKKTDSTKEKKNSVIKYKIKHCPQYKGRPAYTFYKAVQYRKALYFWTPHFHPEISVTDDRLFYRHRISPLYNFSSPKVRKSNKRQFD